MTRKNFLKRIISSFVSAAIAMTSLPIIPIFAETGTNSYSFDGYNVEYSVKNEWSDGQAIEVKITNTGDEPILNWAFKYNAQGEISDLWNASVYDAKETSYIIKNAGWNYEIAPDASVSFGYTLSDYSGTNPEQFELCAKRVNKTDGYDVQYNITNEWDTGLQGEIVITNTSEEPLEAWELSFDSTFAINNLWDGRIISSEENHYVVASEMWSNPINVGESKIIGFTGSKLTEEAPDIGNCSLSSVVISNSSHETSLLDMLIISAYGRYIPETDTIDVFWASTDLEGIFEVMTSDDNVKYIVIGSITDADCYSIPALQTQKYIKVRQTANKQTAESQPFVVIKTENGFIIDYIDTDNDGLYDYIEKAIGSDLANADTDSDGLSDYDELLLTNTDPLVYNSVNEALSDAEADCDEDGLSNKTEIENGTNPLLPDTDNDGINDGNEAELGTDPLHADTDGDGANDGWEVANGYDPLVFNELFEITKSSEGKNISVSVEAALDGGQIESLEISEVTESPFLNETTPGYIGSAFDFSVNGDIGEAIISFTFDEALLGDDFIPAVYYFNEDTQLLEELETSVEGNTARAKTTHFSQYILLNKFEFEESEIIINGTLERIETDVVFVIDNSGSMVNNDPSCLRKLLTKEFITNLPEGDKASIIRFNSSYTLLCDLTDNKDVLLSAADKITSGSGNTNGSSAINRALTVLSYSEAANKAIIFLTDGIDTSQSYSYADLMNKASDNEIRIYTIALGNADEVLLNEMANGTGGKFYSAASSVDLNDIYESIREETIDRSLDSNNDGISDYYTKLVCEGFIRLGTGIKSCFSELSYEEINADIDGDYDNDGKKNGDEIYVEINEATGKVYIKMESNPTKEDSDGDGLLDGDYKRNSNNEIIAPIDKEPLKYNGPSGAWKNHIQLASESDVPTELIGWYGYTNPQNLSNSGSEGFEAFAVEFEYLLNNGQLAINPFDCLELLWLGFNCTFFSLVSLPDMGQDEQNNICLNIAKQSFDSIMKLIERQIVHPEEKKVILASLGSRLLNFKSDSDGNVHSQQYTWQSIGGYCNIYDNVFREFTNYNMDNEKFPFSVGDTEYILWIWHGDYLNLGAGAEMGIYYRPDWLTQDPNGIDHYFADQNFRLPMDLYLYNYENGVVDEILAWNPDEPQWWITGFNPQYEGDIDVNKQVLIGSVDFSEHEEMYESFKLRVDGDTWLKNYVIFNENTHVVWLCWYNKEAV